jgi:hypothetical protein
MYWEPAAAATLMRRAIERATSQTSWSEPGVVAPFPEVREPLSRVLLVALAAYGQERRSSEAGFDAPLVRPVRHEDLTRVLGRAAGGNG